MDENHLLRMLPFYRILRAHGRKRFLQFLQRSFFPRLVVHALFWRLHLPMLLPLCFFFTSTLFKGCASSKTSSSVCAPSLQGLRLVLLCNKPALSSSLSRSFCTVPTFLPSLSSSFSHSSFCLRQPNGPFVPRRKIHIIHPTYPVLVHKFALLCLKGSPLCFFSFARPSFNFL